MAMDASAVPSKVCAACGGRYPGDALFCPSDGTPLQSAASGGREVVDPYLGQEISGHIEIQQLVGVGAMGRVYRAFQRGIDRDVAVKILHRELSANAQLVSRFTREAKVASRLQHPNVVQVLLAGQLPDRALYMVMEYLDGLSLQSALAAAGEAFPLPRALHVALQLCDATGEAHAQGIVHRDLKPENVMLVRRGHDPDFVKVLDFGIARINWGEQSVATAAGLIFGTARYISPEGAQGNIVGPASDVYAIGTLLYQMLSGRTPFDGDQAVGLLVQQIYDPAPPLRSIPRAAYVPEPIAEVVMAALVKDPAKREPDARALGQAIFDAAKIAGLSPDEFSRPMLKRQPSAIKLPSVERTKQLALTPDVAARMTPAAANGGASNGPAVEAGQDAPAVATVKWEPPDEFQARLVEAIARSPSSRDDRASGVTDAASRPRLPSVDETMDDMTLDAQQGGAVHRSAPVYFPTPAPAAPREPLPRTVPGDADGPPTHYSPPLADVTTGPPRLVHTPARPEPSSPDLRRASSPEARAPASQARSPSEEGRSRPWLVIALCFVLGAMIALGWAWKVGKVGGGDELERDRIVARATDAMFKNHFHAPPGENVKELTDDGLRRWPDDRKLIDVRVRAANELISQAIAQRSAGDVLEALRLVKIAHELDPHDASATRLASQYEAELASFSPSAAPTLATPPTPTPTPMPTPKASASPKPPGPPPARPAAAPPPPPRVDYKAVVDVSIASPRLGQTVELVARVAPSAGDFDAPTFTIVGPGVPGGVRVPAQSPSPGVFRASYAFLEPGRFDLTFTTEEGGRPITAKRAVTAASPPPPAPTGSVKWM